MPQSLAKVHVHMVFSTKGRLPLIDDRVRGSLHRYMAAVLKNLGCAPGLINSVEDHAHLLFELGRTVSLSDAAEEVKKSSSKWMKTQGERLSAFRWQNGYGVFGVSASNADSVRRYIARQREHHRRVGFQNEFRAFLRKHGVEFDERYVWD